MKICLPNPQSVKRHIIWNETQLDILVDMLLFVDIIAFGLMGFTFAIPWRIDLSVIITILFDTDSCYMASWKLRLIHYHIWIMLLTMYSFPSLSCLVDLYNILHRYKYVYMRFWWPSVYAIQELIYEWNEHIHQIMGNVYYRDCNHHCVSIYMNEHCVLTTIDS